MTPGKRRLVIATVMLLTTSGVVLGTGGISSATSQGTSGASTPVPVQDALSVVASSLGDGPLTVDTSAGSVAGGVWSSDTENGSSGVSQHWSLKASDATSTIVLGIMVTDGGTEVVSGWVPGASEVSNWIFNTSGPTPGSVYQVTVPATPLTFSPSSTAASSKASPAAGTPYTCSGYVATPYVYGTSIYYSGSVICNIDVLINDLLRLWDYYNNSTYEIVSTAASAGAYVDYPMGTATCNPGYAPRNAFHTEMISNLIAPPGYVPAEQQADGNSPPVNLPCNQ